MLFAIFDTKAEAFLRPFFLQNHAMAIRAFEQAANDENSDFHRYAADYHLFQIGEWDEHKGNLVNLDPNLNLGCALQYINQLALFNSETEKDTK